MNNRIAFLGDSLTYAGNWEQFFPTFQIANHGISGQKSSQIISRLDQVITWKPDKLFVMMGINDLGEGLPIKKIISNYSSLIKKIKDKSKVVLFVQSILPVNFRLFSNQHFSNDDIVLVNKLLEELCASESVTYIDLYSSFVTYGNELITEFTYDGLHLNDAGYRIWKNRLATDGF